MAALPKGFYEGPDGQQRFWDGKEWHSSSAPSDSGSKARQPVKERLQSLKPKTRRLVIGLFVAGILVVGGASAALVVSYNAQIAAQAQEEADAKASEERAKASEERAKQAEIDLREAFVAEDIQPAVQTMAEKHLAEGVIDGSVISVRCSEASGEKINDLSLRTMVLECFVSTADNGDGTFSGYYYNASVDWDTGRFSYGLGRAP
jgi:hypothetical protein